MGHGRLSPCELLLPRVRCGSLVRPAVNAWVETQAGANVRWSLLPVAAAVGTGVAILHHGLYDIDRIISRTIVYAGVTAVLGLGYSGVVLLTGQLLRSGEDVPAWVIAATTLAAAAIFRPIRQVIQARVERHFNRSRYDMRRTVDAFNARLRDDVPLTNLRSELIAVIEQTMQPKTTTVWLVKAAKRHQAHPPIREDPPVTI